MCIRELLVPSRLRCHGEDALARHRRDASGRCGSTNAVAPLVQSLSWVSINDIAECIVFFFERFVET